MASDHNNNASNFGFSSPLFVPEESPEPHIVDILEGLPWPNGEVPDLRAPEVKDAEEREKQMASANDPPQQPQPAQPAGIARPPTFLLPRPGHTELKGNFSFSRSENEEREVGRGQGNRQSEGHVEGSGTEGVEQQQQQQEQRLAGLSLTGNEHNQQQGPDLDMPDFHVNMQQPQLTDQPDLTFDEPKSEPDQEPSFATNVNQPQFTFAEPKSEPDTDRELPSFATNINQPNFTFDEPKSEHDSDDGLPSFTTNVGQPQFHLYEPELRPVSETGLPSFVTNVGQLQFSFDQEPKSEPDTEHGLPSNAANVTQPQFALNQQLEADPARDHTQQPQFIDVNDEPKSEPDQEPHSAINVNVPQITIDPPEVNQQPAPASPIANSNSLRPEPVREPAPRSRPRTIRPFTSRAERARRKAAADAKAASDAAMTQNAPKRPVPVNNSSVDILNPSTADRHVPPHSPKQPMQASNSTSDPLITLLTAAKTVPPPPEPPVTTSKSIRETLSALGAAHNVPLETAPTQKSMHDTLSEYYAAGKAKPYSPNATGALLKSNIATNNRASTISVPKTKTIRPPRSFQEINADTSIFSAPARTYTHISSDPESMIHVHYHHLDKLARELRDKEAIACDREENLAAMLEQAQTLRNLAVQERSDGLVLIRHRRRELAALEGKTKDEIDGNPEWRETLRPLELGEMDRGSEEFEVMAKEARRRERRGEMDEYDSA